MTLIGTDVEDATDFAAIFVPAEAEWKPKAD
ncbi:unnamed protein product, partial [marine sediment metagenome]